ncbi:MAG: helix-turn-helix domain-containing protein [Burkholderiales bacterium]
MVELKSVVAMNITLLRKGRNWTQTELAEKLNYSDKAVSKWERGESIPDVTVLKRIADLFGVTVDYLLEAEHKVKIIPVPKQKKRNRLIIALLSASSVFLVATVLFVFSGILPAALIEPAWMIYIYALPVALIVLLVFNSIWGKRAVNIAIITLLVWSALLAVYLSFRADNIWLIFVIGVPAQVIILLSSGLKPAQVKHLLSGKRGA